MGRLRKVVVPFRWNTVTVSFTQGTAGTVNLATFLVNNQRNPLTYSVIGTLPTGITLSGSTLTYNGTSPAAAASVQFRATDGTYTADSSSTTVAINALPVTNRAPVWTTIPNQSVVNNTSLSVALAPYASDPDQNPLTFGRTGSASDTAPAGVTVSSAGLLTVPAGTAPGTYTVEVYADDGQSTAEADWLSRSTGPGVVWAHDFRYDGELTQFLWTDQGARNNGIKPRIVSDYPSGTAGRSIECMSLGAKLAANFGVSDTTATFDDLTDWPSGDFYFIVGGNPNASRSYQNGIPYNRFYCPAGGRSGNTLTGLTLDTTQLWSTLSATRQSWIAGDSAGHEVQNAWVRPFAALSSGNGLPAADVNNAGVTARAWQPIATNSAYATWGFGYYGHSDYHAQTWTSAMATASGSSAHGNCWDGTEFYLQMRVKVDPRFWDNHVPSNDQATNWSHKHLFIQTQQSSSQQICPQLNNKNKFWVPGNPGVPFHWFTQQGRTLTQNGSYQGGGPWESTATFVGTPKPATGQATPDGSSAWAYDNDWVTLLFHIVPGHDGVADSVLEAFAARRDGTYFTLFSGSTQLLNYQPTTDLPGFCALWLSSYMNMALNVSSNAVPVKSHFKRWTQIIFSKQFIPAPAVGA